MSAMVGDYPASVRSEPLSRLDARVGNSDVLGNCLDSDLVSPLPQGATKVDAIATLPKQGTISGSRKYRTCAKKKRRSGGGKV